jgi:hypothetical protein
MILKNTTTKSVLKMLIDDFGIRRVLFAIINAYSDMEDKTERNKVIKIAKAIYKERKIK